MSSPKLLVRVRTVIRLKHYSPKTEKAYVAWIRRFVHFCDMRHPERCGAAEVRDFLERLATHDGLAASTQNQALAALQFLYEQVLEVSLGRLPAFARAKHAVRVPNVLEPTDVAAVIAQLSGVVRLVVMLMYGAGLRLEEALSLRVKDVDARRRVLTVRGGKGNKDRRTMLPETLVEAMTAQLMRVRTKQLQDMQRGGGYVRLPDAIDRKIPSAVRDWRWSWLFPAAREYVDRDTRHRFRHHLHPSTVQRAITMAGVRSGINQRVTAHTMRHSFATQLLRAGYDIRTVQELLGHRDLNTTMIYLHVLDRGAGVRSPLDLLRDMSKPSGAAS